MLDVLKGWPFFNVTTFLTCSNSSWFTPVSSSSPTKTCRRSSIFTTTATLCGLPWSANSTSDVTFTSRNPLARYISWTPSTS